MTPTEKDAMALAVIQSEADENRLCGGEMFAAQLEEARAHLASRIAELEDRARKAEAYRDQAAGKLAWLEECVRAVGCEIDYAVDDGCAYNNRAESAEAELAEANERSARHAAQYQHEFEAHSATIERAERAEAELAAVRANADRYLHLREANNADPTPFIAQRYEHGIMQWTGEEADAAIDAARGGE